MAIAQGVITVQTGIDRTIHKALAYKLPKDKKGKWVYNHPAPVAQWKDPNPYEVEDASSILVEGGTYRDIDMARAMEYAVVTS